MRTPSTFSSRLWRCLVPGFVVVFLMLRTLAAESLDVSWEDNYLTIRGSFPGGEIQIMYLEAYCRPGSTDRPWEKTVIPHRTQRTPSDDGVIRLRDELADGVIVDHEIRAGMDEVDFRITAMNPEDRESEAHWAQPCIRVAKFTGAKPEDARQIVPPYARKCFLYLDGKLTRMPTTPWAEQARYTPGQVYAPRHVDRNDVNPRPLSILVPSHGLCGCFSSGEEMIMAVAWEPYQEIFQGVITCIHNDFRIAGLKPGEKKNVRGKLYIIPADPEALFARYSRDFPEQTGK